MKKNVCKKLCVNLTELRSIFINHIAQRFQGSSLKKIHRALKIAENVHKGQRRDNGKPYLLHPLRIALSLMQELNINDADLLCASLLHDVLEDHEHLSHESIRVEFGERVSSIVKCLTKPNNLGKTHEEVNEVYFKRLEESDEDTKLAKLIDKLDNLRDAVNCPDNEKRLRTIEEAKNFYLSLASSLKDSNHRRITLNLLNEAITTLEVMQEPYHKE